VAWEITANGFRWVLACIAFFFITVTQSATASPTDNLFIPTSNPLPNLAVCGKTNGQVQLALNAEPGIPHFVEASSNLVNWSLMTTNSDNATNRQISLNATTETCFYRASRSPIAIFAYVLAAKTFISINGIGVISDSWNSHDLNQSLNGQYNGYAGTNGDFALVNGIMNLGNTFVNGDIYLGPGTALVTGPYGGASGQILPDQFFLFPEVVLPTINSNGNPILWTNAPGTVSAHSFTNSGYFTITDSGSLTVEAGANVVLLVQVTNYSPASINIKGGTTNPGTLTMYQEAGNITLGRSNTGGAINNRPENFIYFGLPGVTEIMFGTGSTFVGAVYAPSASGNFFSLSTMGFIGSCVVSNATVNGHVLFHYDTSLRTNGPCR